MNGRTVFQFDLENRGDIPTVILKSKETDIPKYKVYKKAREKIQGKGID